MDEEQRRWLHQGGECGKQCSEIRYLFRISTTYRDGIYRGHICYDRQGGENVANVTFLNLRVPISSILGRDHDDTTKEDYLLPI